MIRSFFDELQPNKLLQLTLMDSACVLLPQSTRRADSAAELGH